MPVYEPYCGDFQIVPRADTPEVVSEPTDDFGKKQVRVEESAAWDETLHPRNRGKFAPKSGGETGHKPATEPTSSEPSGVAIPENVGIIPSELFRPVGTPNFRRWFGDSKIVDGRGEPLVVYHGSPVVGFDEFDMSKVNRYDPDAPYNGVWFSSSKKDAETSGRFPWGRPDSPIAEVRPFYLALQNPATHAQAFRVAREIEPVLSERYPDRSLQEATREELQRQGYDGVVHSPYVELTPEMRERVERGEEVDLGKHRYTVKKSSDPAGGYDLYQDGMHITGYSDLDEIQDQVGAGTFVAFDQSKIKLTTNRGTWSGPKLAESEWDESKHPRDQGRFAHKGESSPEERGIIPGELFRQTETPEFKRWFGNSQVVDGQGQPLVLYHGTRSDFDEFKTRRSTQHNRLGAYFSANPEGAGIFASGRGGRILPVYVKIANPFDVRDLPREDIAKAAGLSERAQFESRSQGRAGAYATLEWLDKHHNLVPALKRRGYDGIVFSHESEGDTYVAFDPAQVKSASGNTGTFDPASKKIGESFDESKVSRDHAGRFAPLGKQSLTPHGQDEQGLFYQHPQHGKLYLPDTRADYDKLPVGTNWQDIDSGAIETKQPPRAPVHHGPSDQAVTSLASLRTRLPRGYRSWLKESGNEDEPESVQDYLREQHGIEVGDDGLVEFDRLTPTVRKIVGDQPVVVLHHTSDAILDRVQQEGLRPAGDGVKMAGPYKNSGAGVYVTTEHAGPVVDGYATSAVQAHGGNLITLRIKTTLDELTPDPDDEELGLSDRQFILPRVRPEEIVNLKSGKVAETFDESKVHRDRGRFAHADGARAAAKPLSRQHALLIAKEVGTGTGEIAKLADGNPELRQASIDAVRQRVGDGPVSLYRTLQIEQGKTVEHRDGTASLSDNLAAVVKIGSDMPGMVMTGKDTKLLDTVLVRYDVDPDQVVADVRTLFDRIPAERDSTKIVDKRGNDYTLGEARQTAQRESEVVADLTGQAVVATLHLDSQQKRAVLDMALQGPLPTAQELILKLRKEHSMYLGLDDNLKYHEDEALQEAQALIDQVQEFVGPRRSRAQTETPQFRQWFGKSQVVDSAGQPLRVYHGTHADFDVFDESHTGQTTGNTGHLGQGFYFSTDPAEANTYADSSFTGTDEGGNIKPVYLSLQHPFVMDYDHQFAWRKELIRICKKHDLDVRSGHTRISLFYLMQDNGGEALSKAFKAEGYDGVMSRYEGAASGEVVAFYPEQIKSASGNKGTFNETGKIAESEAFDPEEHPRDDGGRFTLKGTGDTRKRHPETPAFKQWFGSSKVVDQQGQPLVLYHGATEAIDAFDPVKTKDGGLHFGTTDQAEERLRHTRPARFTYTGEQFIPVYLRMERPLRMIDDGTDWGEKIAQAKSQGYDGIVYLNRFEATSRKDDGSALFSSKSETRMTDDEFREFRPSARDSYIAFDASQIKSAIGNRGTFNPASAKISESYDESQHPRDDDGRWTHGDQVGHWSYEAPDDGLDELIELGPEVRQATSTPAFRNWFRGSKAVDPQGEPIVLWHGTTADAFDQFQPSQMDIGFHFGTPEQARGRLEFMTKYERDKGNRKVDVSLVPVYLSLQHPLVLQHDVTGQETPLMLAGELNRVAGLPRAVTKQLVADVSDIPIGDAKPSGIFKEAFREARDNVRQQIDRGELLLQVQVDWSGEGRFRTCRVQGKVLDREGRSQGLPYGDILDADQLRAAGGPEKEISAKLRRRASEHMEFEMAKRQANGRLYRHIEQVLQDLGYDGLIYPNKIEGSGLSYAVFDPSQVKSVFNKTWGPGAKLTESAAFDPADHPRGDGGRFVVSGTGHGLAQRLTARAVALDSEPDAGPPQPVVGTAVEFITQSLNPTVRDQHQDDDDLGRLVNFQFGDTTVQSRIKETPDKILLTSIATKQTDDLTREAPGTGAGTKVLSALKDYADKIGKTLVVPDVTEPAKPYWDAVPWLRYDDTQEVTLDGQPYVPPHSYVYEPGQGSRQTSDSAGTPVATEVRRKLPIDLPPSVQQLHQAFRSSGRPLYLVGGAVRDHVLGQAPKDYDLTTPLPPDEVLALLDRAGIEHPPGQVGKAFGVVLARVDGEDYEIATFRKDLEATRDTAVEFSTMDEDAARRDLTMNALYYDLDSGEVVDKVGGLADLDYGRVRTVGDPDKRFGEDTLRILRLIRFQHRVGAGESLDSATKQAIHKRVAAGLKDDQGRPVAPERIRDEFLKGLKSAKSYADYLRTYQQLGILEKYVLPGLRLPSEIPSAARDPIQIIATLVKENPAADIRKALHAAKYTTEEIQQIKHLRDTLDVADPKRLDAKLAHEPGFLLAWKRDSATVPESRLKEWAYFQRLNWDALQRLREYRVTGRDNTPGVENLEGLELGRAIMKYNTDQMRAQWAEPVPHHPAHQTKTPEFQAWFRQSKAVTPEGTPRVLYHGAPLHQSKTGEVLGILDSFDRNAASKFLGYQEDMGMDRVGSWFSTLPGKEGAQAYSGDKGAIYPVYLSIQNPWRVTFDDFLKQGQKLSGWDKKSKAEKKKTGGALPSGRFDVGPLRRWMVDQGYDGIQFVGKVDHPAQEVWVTLEPEQVKSATGNSGAFGQTGKITESFDESKVHREKGRFAHADGAGKQPDAETARKQTESPAFKAWFGRSKIVDHDGQPLRCYHGSGTTNIQEFRPEGGSEAGRKTLEWFRQIVADNKRVGYMNFRSGSFFSPDPEYAGHYTAENTGVIYPVYIRAENPVYFDMVTREVTGTDPTRTPDAMVLTENGKINEIAVIDPRQVKSASGNQGTYDPHSAKINESAAFDESQVHRDTRGRFAHGEAGGRILYHATNKQSAQDLQDNGIDPTSLNQRDSGFFGPGFYASAEPQDFYGKSLVALELRPDAKVLDVGPLAPRAPQPFQQDFVDSLKRRILKHRPDFDPGKMRDIIDSVTPGSQTFNHLDYKQELTAYARSEGFQAASFADGQETVILDPASVQNITHVGGLAGARKHKRQRLEAEP